MCTCPTTGITREGGTRGRGASSAGSIKHQRAAVAQGGGNSGRYAAKQPACRNSPQPAEERTAESLPNAYVHFRGTLWCILHASPCGHAAYGKGGRELPLWSGLFHNSPGVLHALRQGGFGVGLHLEWRVAARRAAGGACARIARRDAEAPAHSTTRAREGTMLSRHGEGI